MNKNKIIHTLQNGICEIWYTDEYSVEYSMIGTLALHHLPDGEDTFTDVDMMDMDNDQNAFNVFNVNSEIWQTISAHRVIDIEQLTGHGAKCNENKLQAGDEYMKQLELFDNVLPVEVPNEKCTQCGGNIFECHCGE